MKPSLNALVLGIGPLLIAAGTPAMALTDSEFEALVCRGASDVPTCIPSFQEDFVAEGRIGSNTMAGDWEQGIVNWTTNLLNTTPQTAQRVWTSGVAVPFSLAYSPALNGTLTWALGGNTLIQEGITEAFRVPQVNHLFLRTRASGSQDNSTSLTNLKLNGVSIADVVSTSLGVVDGSDVDYLPLSVSPGGFTLTGNATLSWTGIAPRGSSMAFQVKGGYTAPSSVPGPLPLFGAAAAFGYSRKLRKRINCSELPEARAID